MRKILVFGCALLLTGCAWFGWGEDSETVAQSEPVAAAPDETMAEAPAVQVQEEAAASKSTQKAAKSPKAAKGAKSEAQIKAELDAMGKKLAAQSGRTLLPNRSNPEYKQVGGEWVASFIDVDSNHVTTDMRPGSNGTYVGSIHYQEKFMECRGATKQAALSGSCNQVRTRNMNELIRYNGSVWED